MAYIDNCCVDQVTRPVQVFEVAQDDESYESSQELLCQKFEFCTSKDLTTHFGQVANQYSCRLMFVFNFMILA